VVWAGYSRLDDRIPLSRDSAEAAAAALVCAAGDVLS
jgi:hypothetical protein